MTKPLLEIHDLETHFSARRRGLFRRPAGVVKAVAGVRLNIGENEVVGLVGESGCGKSTLARAIVSLAPITHGHILFCGKNLCALGMQERRRVSREIQMVFQDPYASLNPRMTVFDTLAEPLRVHGLAARREVPGRVRALMDQVGLAARFVKKYPHEFSGGQRQRIAVARALALDPRLILADEPVSALDVSVQAQILNLLGGLRKQRNLSMLFISHDLAVVRHLADRVAVMYLGRVVELGPAEEVFERPLHPYTQALLSAIPVPGPSRPRGRIVLKGDPPSPLNPPPGCPFHPRCPLADEACAQTRPEMVNHGAGHAAACLKVNEAGVTRQG